MPGQSARRRTGSASHILANVEEVPIRFKPVAAAEKLAVAEALAAAEAHTVVVINSCSNGFEPYSTKHSEGLSLPRNSGLSQTIHTYKPKWYFIQKRFDGHDFQMLGRNSIKWK